MSVLSDSSVSPLTIKSDPVVRSILMLLDTLGISTESNSALMELRRSVLAKSTGELDAADLIDHITALIAKDHLRREQGRNEIGNLLDTTQSVLKEMEQSIMAAEMQAQSSFQGAQKTSNVMDRQVRDIFYRLKISSNVEGMKVWLEQRLSILQARLDDLEAQGSQQQTTLSSRMQKLSKHVQTLDEQLSEFEKSSNEAQSSIYIDILTGVDNRIGFEAAVGSLLKKRSASTECNTILLLCDVDRLGNLNSKYGIDVGDKVLQQVARKLRGVVGSENYLARIGGDRFGVLLLNTELEAAHLVSDKMCLAVENMSISTDNDEFSVSISCGYTGLLKSDSPETILRRAGEAVGQAKVAGGNCCWCGDTK